MNPISRVPVTVLRPPRLGNGLRVGLKLALKPTERLA